MKIVNIVATVEMKHPFDLDELLDKLPGAELLNHWVKIKLPPDNKYIAFYKNGKFLITGAKSEVEVNDIANNVILFLEKYDVRNKIKRININNCVIICQLDFEVCLEDLITKLIQYDAYYEPEQFPALKFKDKYDITYLLFRTGKVTITGVKSIENAEKHIAEFKNLIYKKSNS